MPITREFDCSKIFPGGNGFFVEFEDVVKPVYLYSILDMIISKRTYGLPTNLISNFSILSILEWYKSRRYRNPILQLDWQHKLDQSTADKIMSSIRQDQTIYDLSPLLDIGRLLEVYISQHMIFPWYIYSEEYDPHIPATCERSFGGIKFTYLHGDLRSAIKKTDQNFTYIFSDIEKLKNAAEILHGTCSHLLLTRDYRYNYTDNFKTFKHNLTELAFSHPFLRIETTLAMSVIGDKFNNVLFIKPKMEGGDVFNADEY